MLFSSAALQATNSPSVDALKRLHRAAGEDVSAACGMSFSGSWKIFCRENCESGNILIQTRENKAQTERYSIEYLKEFSSDIYVFYVKISKLKPSDSGLYRCGLGDSSSAMIYQEFRLVVAEASGSDSANLTSTPAAPLSSNYSLTPSASSETTNQSVLIRQRPTSEEMSTELLLVAALTLTLSGILLSGALLVLCRKRCHKHLEGLRTRGGSTDQQSPVYENFPSAELIYQNAKPVSKNKK
ncbi:uncharacterized protein LOC119777728 isoform X2 [Cyprinodon tularosa]|uniref:uncharacterized protein LOC119777728 isoform X2 n=1 Tax=Cyprinodon tularosa TaxID=77115 RepID=UPI0018E2448A|nr:uncharacterized protein LOC119777728 isoform X2 [Cyprinodon tularosa]